MIRKWLAIGIILLLVGTVSMPGVSAKISDTSEVYEKSDIYFFRFAFIIGEYENCEKWFGSFSIWNSDYSIHSINVLGYSSYQNQYIFVKACIVDGNSRIGFIGPHHCCIFSYFSVTVES